MSKVILIIRLMDDHMENIGKKMWSVPHSKMKEGVSVIFREGWGC